MSTINVSNLKNASAASPAIVLAADGSATANLSSVNGGPIAGTRNRIINGDMRIWQRGTSGFTSGYAVDRWYLNGANAASRSTDVPSGFQYSLSFSISSSTVCGASQRIESVNTTELASQSVTIGFWFKRTGAAGNLQVNLDYPTAVDNYTATGAIGATQVAASPSTSWTYYSVTFPSINANAANGLQVSIFTTNGTNASLGGLVTGVQLEPGSTATPFERRSYGQELALCQRYCEIGDVNVTAAYIVSTVAIGSVYFKVTKRASPTLTYSGTPALYVNGTTPAASSPITDGTPTVDGFNPRVSSSASTSGYAARLTAYQFLATAEL